MVSDGRIVGAESRRFPPRDPVSAGLRAGKPAHRLGSVMKTQPTISRYNGLWPLLADPGRSWMSSGATRDPMNQENADQERRRVRYSPPTIELPEGISPKDWNRERTQVQNPRIRSFLGCTKRLEAVLDSNYAILHCSPDRLRKIWREVRETCELMQNELAPTLQLESIIPALEAARQNSLEAYDRLAKNYLFDVQHYPERISDAHLPQIRKLLGFSIGQIHAFLRDAFGEIVSNDPRSRFDADYFLSKQFAHDIEESEWLYSSVYDLCDYVGGLAKLTGSELSKQMVSLDEERLIPHPGAWSRTQTVVGTLRKELITKLGETLTLRGIRFDDTRSLELFAREISERCDSVNLAHDIGLELIEAIKDAAEGGSLDAREQSIKDLTACHQQMCGRLIAGLDFIQTRVEELAGFLPLWRDGIEHRRSLMLSKIPDDRKTRTR